MGSLPARSPGRTPGWAAVGGDTGVTASPLCLCLPAAPGSGGWAGGPASAVHRVPRPTHLLSGQDRPPAASSDRRPRPRSARHHVGQSVEEDPGGSGGRRRRRRRGQAERAGWGPPRTVPTVTWSHKPSSARAAAAHYGRGEGVRASLCSSANAPTPLREGPPKDPQPHSRPVAVGLTPFPQTPKPQLPPPELSPPQARGPGPEPHAESPRGGGL